jgi:hypothetical protein
LYDVLMKKDVLMLMSRNLGIHPQGKASDDLYPPAPFTTKRKGRRNYSE